VARQLKVDFGDTVDIRYHDITRPDESAPEELTQAIADQRLPYPVSVVNDEIVSAGDVSYFVLSDKVKMLTQAPAQ
jgi:disulfide oxidoreductase YuzD